MNMGKPEDWGKLEKYDEEPDTPKEEKKDGVLKKLWRSTIFPDKIKKYKEEKKAKEELHHQAKMEAMAEVKDDIKDVLKEKYKQDAIDKVTGKARQDKMNKFANAFKMDSGSGGGLGSGGGIGSTEKIEQMLGMGGSRKQEVVAPTKKKKKKKKGAKKQAPPPKPKNPFDMDEKIKRMLE